MPTFDTLAKVYEPLEKISFAGRLQKTRLFCISYTEDLSRALLIGDGDGRFSSKLLAANPHIKIDSVDISRAMLEVSKKRAGSNGNRLYPRLGDATNLWYPRSHYDFIGLHFCLDCFSQFDTDELLTKLEDALQEGGIIAHSDFQTKRTWHRLVVRCLYLSFRLAAGLKTQRLPEVKWSEQIQPVSREETLGGLLFSEVLKKRQAIS